MLPTTQSRARRKESQPEPARSAAAIVGLPAPLLPRGVASRARLPRVGRDRSSASLDVQHGRASLWVSKPVAGGPQVDASSSGMRGKPRGVGANKVEGTGGGWG